MEKRHLLQADMQVFHLVLLQSVLPEEHLQILDKDLPGTVHLLDCNISTLALYMYKQHLLQMHPLPDHYQILEPLRSS